MSGNSIIVFGIGFLAQALFSARLLVQWLMSERAHRVVSPSVFWILSLVASSLLFIYGWLRDDFSIMLGQFLGYYIYIWNIDAKGLWKRLHIYVRCLLFALPFVVIGRAVAVNGVEVVNSLFRNSDIPLWLVLFGTSGQIIFTLRFVYQWYYSRSRGESLLPVGFWIISLVGSFMICSYGILRLDPVIILGQSLGFVAYIRNIMLYHKEQTGKLSDNR